MRIAARLLTPTSAVWRLTKAPVVQWRGHRHCYGGNASSSLAKGLFHRGRAIPFPDVKRVQSRFTQCQTTGEMRDEHRKRLRIL